MLSITICSIIKKFQQCRTITRISGIIATAVLIIFSIV